MKMSETSWDFCGVFRCCTGALLDVALDKDVHPGDTVTCPICDEEWALGNDGVWRTMIQREITKL